MLEIFDGGKPTSMSDSIELEWYVSCHVDSIWSSMEPLDSWTEANSKPIKISKMSANFMILWMEEIVHQLRLVVYPIISRV